MVKRKTVQRKRKSRASPSPAPKPTSNEEGNQGEDASQGELPGPGSAVPQQPTVTQGQQDISLAVAEKDDSRTPDRSEPGPALQDAISSGKRSKHDPFEELEEEEVGCS